MKVHAQLRPRSCHWSIGAVWTFPIALWNPRPLQNSFEQFSILDTDAIPFVTPGISQPKRRVLQMVGDEYRCQSAPGILLGFLIRARAQQPGIDVDNPGWFRPDL